MVSIRMFIAACMFYVIYYLLTILFSRIWSSSQCVL